MSSRRDPSRFRYITAGCLHFNRNPTSGAQQQSIVPLSLDFIQSRKSTRWMNLMILTNLIDLAKTRQGAERCVDAVKEEVSKADVGSDESKSKQKSKTETWRPYKFLLRDIPLSGIIDQATG